MPRVRRWLEAALNDPLIRDEAAEVLRVLIEKVGLLPRAEAKSLDAVCSRGARSQQYRMPEPSRIPVLAA